jgi:hypothetical protein
MRRTPMLCAALLLSTAAARAQKPAPPGQTPAPTGNAPAAGTAAQVTEGKTGLRVHIITTRSTYIEMPYDVFNVATKQVVAQGTGVDETQEKTPQVWELEPGLYKIVQHGQPFDSKTDFATAVVQAGQLTDFVVVVEPDTFQFRGSGVVSGELPKEHKLLGFRIAATVGGSLMLNERENVIGSTSGFTTVAALFGNFSLVFDRNNHFLSISSDQSLGLTGTPTSSIVRNTDRWEGSALYAYNFNNPYLGPYGRAWFKTQIAPGYLYLQSDAPQVEVDVSPCALNKTCAAQPPRFFGAKANPDDLRARVADPFSPFILQEEVGANLKAVNLDLLLIKLAVATRIGFGFREGFISNLLVVDESGENPAAARVLLHKVDDYSTVGPVIGANANVTFARWLYGSSGFQMMLPVSSTDVELDNTVAGHPELGYGAKILLDFTGTAGLRLPLFTDFLFGSFDWTFRLERDAFITARTQFDQTLMARVNLSLF